MADNTIIQQGSFVGTGNAVTLQLRSDVDWIQTVNYTQTAAATQNAAVGWYWQRGMAAFDGIATYHAAASQASSTITGAVGWNAISNNGFALIDSSSIPSPAIATTQSTNATSPLVSTANTGIISVGSVVRVTGTAQNDINGLAFTVGAVNPGVSFTMLSVLANVPGAVGGAGTYRFLAPDLATYRLFYPSNRTIGNITQAVNAQVTTLVQHGLVAGQAVRFVSSAAEGMIEINGLTGIVQNVVDTVNFTVNINTTGFTAFAYPLFNVGAYTPAEVIPFGANPSATTNLNDAVFNDGYIGIVLGGGIQAPAGANADVIYWRAGKSFNT